MKALAEMYRREALEQAALYRAKAAATEYSVAVAAWVSLAERSEREAFVWECAAR